MVNWGVLNSSKSKLIRGSGVNLEIFKNFDEPLGLPIVCFAGRLLRDKGIYEFVSAALLLQKRGLKAHFIIAGDMDTENPTGLKHHEIKNIKKNNIIEFIGFQKDIPNLYTEQIETEIVIDEDNWGKVTILNKLFNKQLQGTMYYY